MSKELPFIAALRLISLLLLSVLVLSLPFVVRADTITGTVKDPSGGVVPGTRIEITGDGITQPLLLTTDEFGKFAAPDLKPGQYSVRVTKDGFEPLDSAIELHGTADLQLKLVIAGQITSVTITEKSMAFANSDSAYRQLRGIGFGDSYVCENYKFNIDVGSFELKTGTLTFLAPVNGIVTGAIFVGEGHFTLKPIARIDIDEMQRRSGSPTAEGDFSRAVFRFTGAIPQLDSPEEVALINCDGGGMNDGIWYAEHLASELTSGKASSQEDRRLFATKHYTIETVIGKNNHFFSRASIAFSPRIEGERVLKFGLLPTLRVTRVTDENGKDLHFIQENRKEDGSFYAILDEAPPVGKDHVITIEYTGDKVLYDAGGGSYYVGARESWYPNRARR